MKKTIVKRILLLTSLFLFSQLSYGQNFIWELCDGEVPHEAKLDTVFVSLNHYEKARLIIEKVEPSCPGSRDGSFKVIDVEGAGEVPNLKIKRFSILEGFTESDIVIGKLYDNLTKDAFSFAITINKRIFQSKEIILGAHLPSRSESPVAVDENLTFKESCPGANDGIITLYNRSGEEEDGSVTWDGGTEGESDYQIKHLSGGSYKFTYSKKYLGKFCCIKGVVNLGTNYCPGKQVSEDFSGDIPSNWFIPPPDSASIKDGKLVFETGGCLYIHLDVTGMLEAISINLDVTKGATVEFIDESMASMGKKNLEVDGNHKFTLNNLFEGPAYAKITVADSATIDNICITTFDEAIEPVSGGSFLKNSPEGAQRSDDAETYCIGDIIYPYNGFSLNGGVSPYTFKWSLDGDLTFDDADSLSHPISFSEEGNHKISLLIEDFVGQRDTLSFEYDAYFSDSTKMGVPELGITSAIFQSLTLCLDDAPFVIETSPASAILSSESAGLNEKTFSPSIAGEGIHFVAASGDVCDTYSGLIISIVPPSVSEINDPAILYNCAEDFDLNSLLTGDTTGLWILDDSIFLFDNILSSSLSPGIYRLSYSIGGGMCEYISSTTLTIKEAPIAIINEVSDTILATDPPIDLNALLDSSSTLDGSWSGGDHIVGNTFDPNSLVPGVYTVTYSVGEGECATTASTDIVVAMSTSTNDIETNFTYQIYPNPVENYLNICSASITVSDQYHFMIYDINGSLISKWESSKTCKRINISNLETGLYLISLRNLDSGIIQTNKFIKK